MVFFQLSYLEMIKKKIYLIVRKFLLIYLSIFSGKIKFKLLSGLNFKIIDFNNYEKNKNLIFRKDFFKLEKNSLVYNFDFINLCNKLGGKRGIEIAKFGIFNWYKANKFKSSFVWDTEQTAKRILNLVYNFDFINSISTKKDEQKLKKILKVNIDVFDKLIFSKNFEKHSLLELKVYILTKFILGNKIVNIKNKFEIIIKNHLDSFSMHKSYNALEQARFINDINEIISMLLNLNNEVDDLFNFTKIKMETVLAQYFHKDGSVALFNGFGNHNIEKIKLALSEKQNIRKIEYPESINGIFYFEDKLKKIFFDIVQPTNTSISKKLSAGTLSIEFSSEKEKIITNCGSLEKTTGDASYLRYSAAHSTVILENTNISEIRNNQPHIKFPQIVSFKKISDGMNHAIEASHNGYMKNYKKIVKRKIYYEENKNSLFGEDLIISSISKNKEVIYHIRFHVLPNINITQTNSKKSVILKTNNNSIWLFNASKDLSLEESVFVDKNDVKQTKQIVIKGITKQNREKIKWSLSKK